MVTHIIKRDGKTVPFNKEKITMAVLSAAISVGGHDRETAKLVTEDVIKYLEIKKDTKEFPTVEEIQDHVEKSLIERGHAKTAKAYIIYRYEHILKRAGKDSITYSSDNIPYQKLWQALSWGVDYNCISLQSINRFIRDNKFEELVRISELFYQNELKDSADVILNKIDDLKIIIISGPSSSGKTTTTIKIEEELKKRGYSFVTLNVDNYYHDLTNQPKDSSGDYDYETPQAIDLKLINQHLKDLLSGNKIQVPFYNFKTGNREGISCELSLKEKEIVLIDSLHGMFEDMTTEIPDNRIFKLYIETLSQIKDKENRFIRWADIRMLRRMVRDMQFRNYNPEQTLTHWHYVRRSELRYIVSQLQKADVIVNSFLAYELPVMKHRLGLLFPEFIRKYQNDSEREDAYERAKRVLKIFDEILECKDESVIPKYSLTREFIGGSGYKY